MPNPYRASSCQASSDFVLLAKERCAAVLPSRRGFLDVEAGLAYSILQSIYYRQRIYSHCASGLQSVVCSVAAQKWGIASVALNA